MEVGRRLLAGDGAAAYTAECENQHMKRVYRFCLTPSYVDFVFEFVNAEVLFAFTNIFKRAILFVLYLRRACMKYLSVPK